MRKAEDIIRRRNAKAIQKLRSHITRTLVSLEGRGFPGGVLRSVPGITEKRVTWEFQPIGYDSLWVKARYLDSAGNLYEYQRYGQPEGELVTNERLMRLGADSAHKWLDRLKQLA